jgi:hypothetical protein
MAKNWTKEYISSDGVVNWAVASEGQEISLPHWILACEAGTIVVVNEDGSVGIFVVAAGEVVPGIFRSLTSTTGRIRVGTSAPPQPLIVQSGLPALPDTAGNYELTAGDTYSWTISWLPATKPAAGNYLLTVDAEGAVSWSLSL